MATQPLVSSRFQAFDTSGNPLSGGKLYTYEAGTTTPLATYTTRAGGTPNANPVILDANGEADVWMASGTLYKLVLKTSADVTLSTVDNYPSPPDLSVLSDGTVRLPDGTVGAPALAFVNDTDCGLYRAGANGLAMSAGAGQVQAWTTTGSTFPKGITVTQSQSNSNAIAAVGNGVAAGLSGTGGSGNGNGVYGLGGSTNGKGVVGEGTGSGVGVQGTGGATGAGGTFAAGADATGGTRQDALIVTNGDIKLQGVAYPTSTTAVRDRLTPANIIKAWVRLTTNGAGGISVSDAFNVASVSLPTTTVGRVTFAQAMANANFCAVGNVTHSAASGRILNPQSQTTAKVDFQIITDAGAALDISANAVDVNIIVLGAQ